MTAIYSAEDNTLKEQPAMEKPEQPLKAIYRRQLQPYYEDMREYDRRITEYNAHIASLRTLPCHPSAKSVWKEGDVLTQNKDYNLYKICAVPGGCFDDLACGTCEVQAWPVKIKSEDELWREVIISVNDGAKQEYSWGTIIAELKEKFTITRKQ